MNSSTNMPPPGRQFGVFISHIQEEAYLALKIKQHLVDALKARVFVSAEDIRLGDRWRALLETALGEAKLMVVLCSRRSITRPWINFESGSSWAKNVPVIPVCHSGLEKVDLPDPLSTFQVLELVDARDCKTLITEIGRALDLKPIEPYDYEGMARNLFVFPERKSQIGVVLTHKQGDWEQDSNTLFNLTSAPPPLQGQWSFSPIKKMDDILSISLHEYSGLIVGSPLHRRMEPGIVAALSNFVMQGGRILLLGFEMGDRHHDANLNDLAAEFGLYFEADIVGPPGQGQSKPYNTAIDFEVVRGDFHPLTAGLTTIRLANVQTLRVLPLGQEWLRVGKNVECRPSPESIEYRNRAFTQAGAEKKVEPNSKGGWLPVAVEAPRGLCGRGAVQAIGTWDLLGRTRAFNHRGNLVLLGRLFEWLSGRPISDSFSIP